MMQPQKKLSFSNNTKRELSFDVKSQNSNNQYDRRGESLLCFVNILGKFIWQQIYDKGKHKLFTYLFS